MKWSVNSAWLAMSARYSKTTSRGRSIVISLSRGPTQPRSLRSRARPQPDGLPGLGVRHDVRALGRRAAPRAAQLAHDRAPRIDVDAFADEGRATAVGAVASSRFAGPHALAQKLALEVGLGDPVRHLRHGGRIRRNGPMSCRNGAARTPRATARRWRVDVPQIIRYPEHSTGPAFVKGPMGKPNPASWMN